MASNNNIWDSELNRLLHGHETEAPADLWDQLSESLDELNHELEFDESLRNTVNEAQLNPPVDIWNAVQTGLGKASLMSGSVGLITKVIITSLVAAGGFTAWYFSSVQDNNREITLSETVGQRAHQQEMEKRAETLSPEADSPIKSPEKVENSTETGSDGLNKTGDNESKTVVKGTESTVEGIPQQAGVDVPSETGSEVNPSGTNESEETVRSSNANKSSIVEGNKPGNEAIFNISLEKSQYCAGEKFTAYLDNPGNKKGYAVLGRNRFLISGEESLMKLEAPALAGDYTIQCFDVEDNPIPGAFAQVLVSSFEAGPFTVTDKGKAAFELKYGADRDIKESIWKIDHKEVGNENTLNFRFSDKEISEHRVVLVQKNKTGCVDSVAGKIVNKTIIAEPIIPNVFTPGGDGFNDEFIVKIEGEEKFLLMIYDDNGTLLFQSRNKSTGWDGVNPHTGAKSRGKHFAVLRYKLIGRAEKEVIGSFTILQP